MKKVESTRLFGDWSGISSTPNMIEFKGKFFMCLLDHDGGIYICSSIDGINWPTKDVVEADRLFGDWSGVSSTPTLVEFNNKLFMCLLDHDGAIYIASSDDGYSWPIKGEILNQRLFSDWSRVGSTPTMINSHGILYMCLLDHSGSIYFVESKDGINWPSKEDVYQSRLFGSWSGVGSTPTLVEFDANLYMCLLDSQGSIFIASSENGIDWPSQETVDNQRLFGDWSGVSSTPTMIQFDNKLYMCLLDHNGAIYLINSPDGSNWPLKSQVTHSRLFGKWSGVPSTPTMVISFTIPSNQFDEIIMCRLSNDGGIYLDPIPYNTIQNLGQDDLNFSTSTYY